MGFEKFFKSLGIEKVDTPPQAGKVVTPPTNTVVNLPQTNFPVPPPVQVVMDEPVEQQYLDHFMQFLEKNNIPGLDYWEFATTLHNMYEKFGTTVTESQLYEMAFTLFSSQGVTAASLVQTAQKYLEMVQAHKKEFDAHISTEGSKALQEKVTENSRLEQSIAAADSQIGALQQQIVAIQNKKATDSATYEANKTFITTEQQKNEAKKAKFESALKVVVDKVKGDIEKIKTNLK